jgi:hypothetical protein
MINSIQIHILEEIKRWKALDTTSLKNFINYQGKDKYLRQVLYRMEGKGLIKSFNTVWGKQKIFSLDLGGYHALEIKLSNEVIIKRETLAHDALCSKAAADLNNLSCVLGIQSEQEINSISGIIPDGSFHGEKNNVPFKIAFEVELTKKSKTRILEKLKIYANSLNFGHVLYLFPKEKLQKEWRELIVANLRPEQQKRFLLFYFENIKSKSFHDAYGIYQGKLQTLKEIFD